jgi:hypothetical protein
VVAKQVARIAPCPSCATPRVAVGALSGDLTEVAAPPALRCVQCALVLGEDAAPAHAPVAAPALAPIAGPSPSPPPTVPGTDESVAVAAPNAALLRYLVLFLLLVAALAVGFAAASFLTRTR